MGRAKKDRPKAAESLGETQAGYGLVDYGGLMGAEAGRRYSLSRTEQGIQLRIAALSRTAEAMLSNARKGSTNGRPTMTMHDFEAKHWVIAAVIVLLAVGAFAYSWS